MNKPNSTAGFSEVFSFVEKNCSPNKPFVVAHTTLTYGMTIQRVKRLTRIFHDMGLRTGDRMIIASRNDIDAIIFFLSALRCGIAAVLIDPETKSGRLKAIIRKSEAKAIAADSSLRNDWSLDSEPPLFIEIKGRAEEKSNLLQKLIPTKAKDKDNKTYPDLLESVQPMDEVAEIPNDLEAYILFTSGTVAEPKGVMISHKNLFTHLATLTRQFGHNEDSRIMNMLPLDHTDGLIQGPLIAFFNGATVYRPVKFSIQDIGGILDSVYTYKITHFEAVPTMLSLINRLAAGYEESFTVPDFRFIICSAGYLEAGLWEDFEKRFKTRIVNFYGLTETVTGGIFCGPSDRDHKIGTIGKPVDCEVKIVDDHGADVPAGTVGEILLKGDHIMKGYCNDPDETNRVIRDGWFHTGDLGFCGEDGFYRIVGRKKAMIKSGGMSINPNEVTEVVNMHPDVLESVTIGYPDETWGEIVVTCVVFRSGSASTETDIIEHTRKHLESYKIPARICVMSSIPRKSSGKIQSEELRKIIENTINGSSDAGADIKQAILQTAAGCFHTGHRVLHIVDGPAELDGWDSLAHLEFITALEEKFDITFTTSEIMRIEKLKDAQDIVLSKLKG